MNCITVGASENRRTTGGCQHLELVDLHGVEMDREQLCLSRAKHPIDPVKNDKTSNDVNGLAAFSSRGPTDDLRIKPDIVAPGTNIPLSKVHQDIIDRVGTFLR
ncbi:MAG: S8 family serine peptidase [Candidatus Moduliflexus flocculans]|nr:S8 family serine peptidase [Candidatus Moduliflexus flocculans]